MVILNGFEGLGWEKFTVEPCQATALVFSVHGNGSLEKSLFISFCVMREELAQASGSWGMQSGVEQKDLSDLTVVTANKVIVSGSLVCIWSSLSDSDF